MRGQNIEKVMETKVMQRADDRGRSRSWGAYGGQEEEEKNEG